MEKEFIPYEQALALKELGFDEHCMSRYYSIDTPEKNKLMMFSPQYPKKYNSEKFEIGNIISFPFISAPLYQQAFRWFREKYDIHGIISYYGKGQWFLEVLDYKGNQLIQIENNTFWSYEEAELECLKKLIEIVKEK